MLFPPTPGRRSPEGLCTATASASATRPRTGATPRRRCWSCWSPATRSSGGPVRSRTDIRPARRRRSCGSLHSRRRQYVGAVKDLPLTPATPSAIFRIGRPRITASNRDPAAAATVLAERTQRRQLRHDERRHANRTPAIDTATPAELTQARKLGRVDQAPVSTRPRRGDELLLTIESLPLGVRVSLASRRSSSCSSPARSRATLSAPSSASRKRAYAQARAIEMLEPSPSGSRPWLTIRACRGRSSPTSASSRSSRSRSRTPLSG